MNQEESEHNEDDGMKKGADSTAYLKEQLVRFLMSGKSYETI